MARFSDSEEFKQEYVNVYNNVITEYKNFKHNNNNSCGVSIHNIVYKSYILHDFYSSVEGTIMEVLKLQGENINTKIGFHLKLIKKSSRILKDGKTIFDTESKKSLDSLREFRHTYIHKNLTTLKEENLDELIVTLESLLSKYRELILVASTLVGDVDIESKLVGYEKKKKPRRNRNNRRFNIEEHRKPTNTTEIKPSISENPEDAD